MIALHSFGRRFYVIFIPHVSVPCFVVWILWLELRIYSQGVWFFEKTENVIHGDKPILTLKISGQKF